jgi:formate hydrogenlyase subunit 3/multisubunit Na+/H+ antiporter MnhD subunit
MTPLDALLALALATLVLTLLCRQQAWCGVLTTLLYGVQLLALLFMSTSIHYGVPVPSGMHFDALGFEMRWAMTPLAWFFALITLGAAVASSWYASTAWGRQHAAAGGSPGLLQAALACNVTGMLLLLCSADLLSLFISWELVSWASFLLMASGGGAAVRHALRYLIYAVAGGMAVLAGIAFVYVTTGSLAFATFVAALPGFSTGQLWLLLALFGGGFAVKMGLLPFHLWQANAYADTPGPGAAFLGAISSRMGLFGMLLVLVQLAGLARFAGLLLPLTSFSALDLLAWVAAFTIILPTFTALRQTDARRLLAWHGIGQGGYMLLGVVMGDALGSAGGLMHVFNHATYQAALFLSVSAVVYRTGTSDLDQLGGLVTRMPVSFTVMLIGIIGLAGLPPMNGFVSKWLIYQSLIREGHPLLFIAAVIGTLGTILSVYKLIHNMFLGQLRVEHEGVREAPWSMTVPMLLLSAVVFATGYLPGLVLHWIAPVQQALGLPVLQFDLGGYHSPGGSLDMIWVVSSMLAGFAIGAIIFYAGGRAQRVHQLDNYAGGHFLDAATRYQYSYNFYPALARLIGPLYRGSFQWLESAFVSMLQLLSAGAQGIYRSVHPSLYLLAAVVIAWLVWGGGH